MEDILKEISKLETVKEVNTFLVPFMENPMDENFQTLLAACRLRISQIQQGKPGTPFKLIRSE